MNLYEIRDKELRLRFERNRLQAEAWRSDRRFTFLIAGTQAGKTSFGPWWLWREIGQRGPGDYLAVTATYDLFKLKMLPEMLRVFCDLLGGGTYQATDRVIQGKDGSRIILRSANSPGGLESATAKAAWLDECGQDDFTLGAWEAVLRRLALSQGRVLGTTTPYNLGWLKTEVVDRWLAGDPDYMVVQGASTENPAFPLAEYERARRTMPAWKFAMFYQGLFERPAGLIYADFTDDNLVDPFPIPAAWPRYVGITLGRCTRRCCGLQRTCSGRRTRLRGPGGAAPRRSTPMRKRPRFSAGGRRSGSVGRYERASCESSRRAHLSDLRYSRAKSGSAAGIVRWEQDGALQDPGRGSLGHEAECGTQTASKRLCSRQSGLFIFRRTCGGRSRDARAPTSPRGFTVCIHRLTEKIGTKSAFPGWMHCGMAS